MICSGAQPKSVLSQIGRKIAEVKRGSGAFVFFFSPASCVPLAVTHNPTSGSTKGCKAVNFQPVPKGEIHMWRYFAMESIEEQSYCMQKKDENLRS